MRYEELRNFPPNVARIISAGDAVHSMCEMRNANRSSVRRPEGKKSLERPRRRWEDNIKNGLKLDVSLDWIHLI
jgi:hypothetical protein